MFILTNNYDNIIFKVINEVIVKLYFPVKLFKNKNTKNLYIQGNQRIMQVFQGLIKWHTPVDLNLTVLVSHAHITADLLPINKPIIATQVKLPTALKSTSIAITQGIQWVSLGIGSCPVVAGQIELFCQGNALLPAVA